MSAEILKEFLVRIGWQNDEDGARKVGEQIRTMTLGAVALGASLESLAATAFAATARISKTYSDIFFQSRKVGSSAENIKAYTYAVEQLGGSAEGAAATLESFRRKIGELGQGQEKWLEPFIGSTRDAKGALRDTAEMVDEFLHSKRFLQASEPLQRKYLEGAGIGEGDWRASQDPNWQRHIEDAKKFNDAIGLDPQELAKKGQAFTEELRAIWMRIGAIRDKFLLNLGFEEPLKKFKKYLDEHSGDILKNLNAFVEAVKPFVIAFTNAAIQVGEFASAIANKLGPDTTAWVIIAGLGLKFTGLSTVIELLASSLIPKLGGALGALMLGPSGVALRAIGGIAALGGLMSYFNIDTSPEGMKRGHKNENWTGHKSDGDGGGGSEEKWSDSEERIRRGEPPPPKKKSLWERTKDWLGEKVGIAPAEGRETAEGQKGGETANTAEDAASLRDLITREAKSAGIDPRIMFGIHAGESAHKNRYDVKDDELESSWGPFQLNRRRGLGRQFEQETGLNVRDPSTIAAQTRWVARYIAKHGRRGVTSNWMGYHGDRNWNPEWGSAGYQPPAKTQSAPAEAVQSDAAKNAQYEAEAAARRHAFVVEMETKRKDAESRAAAKPEVAPQRPVHVPPVKIPDQWEDRPKYDYSKPGHPLIETTPKSSSPTTPQAPPHAVSPRPIGHTTSNSVRHGDVSLNPKTTINVTTPGDAGAAARAIAGVQTRVNADAIRNMQGAAH